MRPAAPRHLLAAIHDVGPKFEGEIDRLRDHLAAHLPPAKIAMLVVPNHWGEAPIVAGTPFARRLRAWADEGVEMFVHGWFHRDTAAHDSAARRFKARHMTAGEGEFLGLNHTTARSRMLAGKALVEDVTGRTVAGFIAPAWLYGPAALDLLAACGFALAEDHMRVWRPADGATLARGPVITWATRTRPRMLSSLLAAQVLRRALTRAPVVRVAVHPGDTGEPRVMASIAGTLGRLGRSHAPARYRDLMPDGAAPDAS